jgi:DNA-binding NarL/FixJ family response regulator
MKRVPRARDHDGRLFLLKPANGHAAGRTRTENGRVADAWPRDLTLLEGGSVRPRQGGGPPPPLRVLLAEGAALVRTGLRTLLEEHDITVAAEAASGDKAVAMAAELRPDVVLMDIRLPGLDGLTATRRILADPSLSQVKVVILGADECEEDLIGALRSGASGFVVLDAEPAEFVRAVRVVAAGGAHLSLWGTRLVLDELLSTPDLRYAYPEQFEDLTARERDIVLLAAQGLSNSEIAERLVISPATVKTHISRAMVKLHARDRAKLVALAYQTGFVKHHRAVDAAQLQHPAGIPPVAAGG